MSKLTKTKKTKKRKKTNKLMIVKIGSDERPAGPEDIKKVEKYLKKFQKNGTAIKDYDVIVTHHAVEFDFMPTL